jgi:hypothetical protein
VVDELLMRLNEGNNYAVRYADDSAIFVEGKFSRTVSDVLRTALGVVQQWCDRTSLSINRNKMAVILLPRKIDIRGLKEPTLSGKIIQLSTEVKNLGLILDKGLT